MNDRTLSKDSTIYNYRLLKRVHHKPLFVAVLWALPAGLFTCDLLLGHPLPLLLSLLGVPFAHTLFILLFYKLREGKAPRGWHWSFRLPWVGFVPGSYHSLSKFRSLQLQLLWINLILLGCFYPWVSPYIIAHIAFVHLWLLLPRFALFFSMRKFTSSGFLKINDKDTSCYAQ